MLHTVLHIGRSVTVYSLQFTAYSLQKAPSGETHNADPAAQGPRKGRRTQAHSPDMQRTRVRVS